jgi:putative FmdB family regulatory protein
LPLYEYRCTKCGYSFEKIQHFNSKPELECPKCHGVLKRPLTAPVFKFKGSGWYVNDYAGKSPAPTVETAAPEPKAPATPPPPPSKVSKPSVSAAATSAPVAVAS